MECSAREQRVPVAAEEAPTEYGTVDERCSEVTSHECCLIAERRAKAPRVDLLEPDHIRVELAARLHERVVIDAVVQACAMSDVERRHPEASLLHLFCLPVPARSFVSPREPRGSPRDI